MESEITVFISVVVAFMLIFMTLMWKKIASSTKPAPEPSTETVTEEEPTEPRAAVRRQRDGLARMRRGRQADAPVDDEVEGLEAPKTKKQSKKDEKKAMADARRAAIDAKNERIAEKEAKRALREAEKEEERLKIEEEEERLRQEKLKAEEEEYEQWKEMISVDDSGEKGADQDTESLLQDFIDFIKQKKVVMLEELGRKFQLKTDDAVSRIESLEKLGRLQGVMDERGKYIYLTQEELEAVATFIKREGRVSINDIAAESNRLINLSSAPEVEPVAA